MSTATLFLVAGAVSLAAGAGVLAFGRLVLRKLVDE
jgi:hypothetical protein